MLNIRSTLMSTKGKEHQEFDYDKHEAALRQFFEQQNEKFPDKQMEGEYNVRLDELGLFDEQLETCVERNTLPYIQLMQRALVKPEDLQANPTNQQGNPEQLLRERQVHLIPRQTMQRSRFRDVEPRKIGQLLQFDCVVTFVSQVLPEILVAAYYCEFCGQEKLLVVQHGSYTAPGRCDSPQCMDRNGELIFVGHRSRFLQARLLLVQEPPLEVPAGATPRSLQCVVRTSVEAVAISARPGEQLRLTGCLIPLIESSGRIAAQFVILHVDRPGSTSIAAVGAAKVAAKLAAAGTTIPNSRKGQKSAASSFNAPEQQIQTLINAFAPAIYGAEMAKLACLCALVGGCPGGAPDAPSRASVNVLLVGDPGAAKSQLLKFAATVAERSAYVAGRGASAAGLTAAVVRLGQGTQTSEYALEPGALVLADGGVCCIDEFDKLDEADRAAIYEALEQQTVSIAKAGVAATLRAQTTVLAAANPLSSRWDDSKSVSDNIGLPEALASRFDCIFILRDKPAPSLDRKIAQHVTEAHMAVNQTEGQQNNQNAEEIAYQQSLEHIEGLKLYLQQCRENCQPKLRPELFDEYVESYVQERRENINSTARSLLSLIRLSQAIAKLRRADYIEQYDIKTARDLLRAAAGGGMAPTVNQGQKRQNQRANAQTVVRSILRQRGATTKETLTQLASDKGVAAADVETALQNLLMLGAVMEDAGTWSLV